jgi:hypothetical protein
VYLSTPTETAYRQSLLVVCPTSSNGQRRIPMANAYNATGREGNLSTAKFEISPGEF